MAQPEIIDAAPGVIAWHREIITRVADGQRFAGLYGTDRGAACELTALIATTDGIADLHTVVPAQRDGVVRYPALSPRLPAAFWYERALHDLSGVVPSDHPRLDPLLLPLPTGTARPLPGLVETQHVVRFEERTGPVDVRGDGMFTLPFGPVRSGVMESIEYLIETPGEEIPHLNIRPHYKHRGIAKQFENRTPADAVLIAERVEGISSVAHAMAFCHAVEALAGIEVPPAAGLIRVVHAEIERIANHLDVTMRLADAAGLAVATARFGWHKERLMRLVSRLCGNRFGRGVVVPGGVRAVPVVPPAEIGAELARSAHAIASDLAALENSGSFLDRLRGTGPLDAALARDHGTLGPIGRASGYDDDDRRARPYDGYAHLPIPDPPGQHDGDAMARARVRWQEITSSVALIDSALAALARLDPNARTTTSTDPPDGYATGWAEAAQGEALYGLELSDGRVRRCFARSASFHNLVLFHDVFRSDIFTDFPFIEASFGLSYAGVAM
jgi:Ni,Fe-hydrogenase III large subunit